MVLHETLTPFASWAASKGSLVAWSIVGEWDEHTDAADAGLVGVVVVEEHEDLVKKRLFF